MADWTDGDSADDELWRCQGVMQKRLPVFLAPALVIAGAFAVWAWFADSLWLQGSSLDSYSYVTTRIPGNGEPTSLLLFLHGSGHYRASRLWTESAILAAASRPHLEAVVVTPSGGTERWSIVRLSALIDQMKQRYGETIPVFVVGYSMGAYAAWQLAEKSSDRVSAIVPIACGYYNISCGQQPVPAWAIHGTDDTVILAQGAVDITEQWQKCGAPVRLTLLPGVGHSYPRFSLSRLGVFEWLAAQ